MADLIGQSLGRYHILEQLGEGGMATVYKAYDTRLEREVAVKVIRRRAFPDEQIERILKRFEREAKALAKLSHPNIVSVLDYGEHEGSPYLVMEYLQGGTLKHHLGKPFVWQDAVRILLPITEALAYAHDHGIIHRDIKPSNILLTEKGQPMLTDFGIAKVLESEETSTLTGSGIGIGTPEYMAPEQWTGHTTPQSDIYSAGVVLYEMVTGRKPFSADTPAGILLKQATDPLPRPKSFIPSLPDGIERILLRALAKNPADRFKTINEFAIALEAFGLPSQQAGIKLPSVIPSKREEARDSMATIDHVPGTGSFTGSTGTQTVDGVLVVPKKKPSSTLWIAAGVVALTLMLVISAGLWIIWNLQPTHVSTPAAVSSPTEVVYQQAAPVEQNILESNDPVPTRTPWSTNTPAEASTSEPYVYVNVETAYLYQGPGLGYNLVSNHRYTRGEQFTVLAIDRSGGWIYCISPDNRKGWIFFDWVDMSFSISIIPTASYVPPAPTPVPTRRPKKSH